MKVENNIFWHINKYIYIFVCFCVLRNHWNSFRISTVKNYRVI